VTQNFKKIRLSTLLDLMLEELNLVYSQKDDLVVITTPDDASATMEVRVYDCRDLLAMPVGMPAKPDMIPEIVPGAAHPRDPFAPPGGAIPAPPGDPFGAHPLDPFAQPGRALPGPPAAPPGDPFGAPPGAAPRGEPGRDSFAPPDVLPQAGFGSAAPQPGAAGGFGMASPGGPGGMMGGSYGGGMGGEGRPQRPLSAEDLKAEQLMNIVTTAVEPNSWSDMGGSGTIGQYNGLIVVSQSARTHTKVEKVLDMLRDAAGLQRTKQSRVVK
jgi:hypothetical protein